MHLWDRCSILFTKIWYVSRIYSKLFSRTYLNLMRRIQQLGASWVNLKVVNWLTNLSKRFIVMRQILKILNWTKNYKHWKRLTIIFQRIMIAMMTMMADYRRWHQYSHLYLHLRLRHQYTHPHTYYLFCQVSVSHRRLVYLSFNLTFLNHNLNQN